MSTKLTGYRRVPTRGGDSLQAIAAREMGNAARWYELTELNDLVPPFITDDEALAGPKVLLAGADIMVPALAAPATGVSQDSDADILGTDIQLAAGRLVVTPAGDLATVSGSKNMVQAIQHVIQTNPGELLFHLDYGSGVRTLIGDPANSITNRLAASFVRRAIAADPRIERARNITATVLGDSISVTGEAETVDNKLVTVGS
jgi:phage baseplate assembly protein W